MPPDCSGNEKLVCKELEEMLSDFSDDPLNKTNDSIQGQDQKRQKQKSNRQLVPWTHEQKTVVKNFFKNHIKARKPPKKKECEELKRIHERLLNNKSWLKNQKFLFRMCTQRNKSISHC